MPIHENVETIEYYPNPELKMRKIWEPLNITSILDVGAGHGGVFDYGYWTENPNVVHREACDIFWIREMSEKWQVKLKVDVLELDKHYAENEFDFVQCCEVLEHIQDNRKALEQLVRVAKKAVFITSADETHHEGPEQIEIEKFNKYQAYAQQPKVKDLKELGFNVFVDNQTKRQFIAWLIK